MYENIPSLYKAIITNKPNSLDENTIKLIVPKKIGAYILGQMENGNFKPYYVGRSDTDVNDRLKKHLNKKGNNPQDIDLKYELFKYVLCDKISDAYGLECALYHELNKIYRLNNKIHPDTPENEDYKCPICNE